MYSLFEHALLKANIDFAAELMRLHADIIRHAVPFQNGELFVQICKDNQLESVKWFIEKDVVTDHLLMRGLYAAAAEGSCELIEWIVHSGYIDGPDFEKLLRQIYLRAMIMLRKNVVDFVLSLESRDTFALEWVSVFHYMCKHDSPDIGRFFATFHPDVKPGHREFIQACRDESFNVVKWMALECDIDIRSYVMEGVVIACSKNNMDIPMWLLINAPDSFCWKNDEGDNTYTVLWLFQYICVDRPSLLPLAKQLYKQTPRLHHRDNLIFVMTCSFSTGREQFQKHAREVVQWIVSLRPDMFKLHSKAGNNKFGIRMLKSHTYNLHTILDFDDKNLTHGVQIFTEKESQWRKRLPALWMAQMQPSSVLYQIPEDVARYIITML